MSFYLTRYLIFDLKIFDKIRMYDFHPVLSLFYLYLWCLLMSLNHVLWNWNLFQQMRALRHYLKMTKTSRPYCSFYQPYWLLIQFRLFNFSGLFQFSATREANDFINDCSTCENPKHHWKNLSITFPLQFALCNLIISNIWSNIWASLSNIQPISGEENNF